jgi:hypothetical protein
MTTPPTEPFVPLAKSTPANRRQEDFRVLVAPRPENARSLRELNSLPGVAVNQTGPGCEPRVTLHRENGCISGIHIQCTCGQIIDLKCAYALPPAASPVAARHD